MYYVYVMTAHDSKLVEKADFPFGNWQQIGWWLDDRGFLCDSYFVQVKFVEGAIR
jgi:hypothetical protein